MLGCNLLWECGQVYQSPVASLLLFAIIVTVEVSCYIMASRLLLYLSIWIVLFFKNRWTGAQKLMSRVV